jgi:hypothetical protein
MSSPVAPQKTSNGPLVAKPLKQETENSCWAACTRMVSATLTGNDLQSDKLLATNLKVSADKVQDVTRGLKRHELYAATDDSAVVPTYAEIQAEIDQGLPIIACVSTSEVADGESVQGGHYIVIDGYGPHGRNAKAIHVIDPASGVGRWVKYDDERVYLNAYKKYLHWGQPYYTQKPAPSGPSKKKQRR